jgi:hypothetical protein
MDYHYVATTTFTAGSSAILMNPINMSPRAGTEADGFAYFRIKKLKFRYVPNSNPSGSSAAGMASGVPMTLPTTVAEVSELLDSVPHGPAPSTVMTETNWTRWVNVRKEVLRGSIEWYNTFAGGFTQQFDVPCTLCFAGTSTDVLLYEIFFTLEFKDPVATANTPDAVLLRVQLRKQAQEAVLLNERRKLLSLLSVSPTPPSSSPVVTGK